MKNEILEMLDNNICLVTFEKANGDTREMVCTRMEEHIDYTSYGTGQGDPDDVVTVWDLENEGFRRFKTSKLLKDVEILEVV